MTKAELEQRIEYLQITTEVQAAQIRVLGQELTDLMEERGIAVMERDFYKQAIEQLNGSKVAPTLYGYTIKQIGEKLAQLESYQTITKVMRQGDKYM